MPGYLKAEGRYPPLLCSALPCVGSRWPVLSFSAARRGETPQFNETAHPRARQQGTAGTPVQPRRGRDASKGHAQTLPLRSAERRRGTAGRVRVERGSRHRDPSPAPHEGLVTWMARPSGAAAGPPTSLQYSCGRPPPPAAASPQVAVAQMLAAAARLKYGGWRLSPIPREPGSSGCARQKVRSGETRAHSSGEPGAAVILRRALPSPLPGRLYSCGGREAGPGEGGEAVRELPAPPREGRREKGMGKGKGPRCVP